MAGQLERDIDEILAGALGDPDGPGVPGVSDDGYLGGAESNAYKPWLELLRYTMTGNMASVLSVYLQTDLDDPQRAIMREMIEAGRMQATATCANRIDKLLELERILKLLGEFRETGGDLPEVDDKGKIGSTLAIVRSELRMLRLKHANPRLAEAAGLKALVKYQNGTSNGHSNNGDDGHVLNGTVLAEDYDEALQKDIANYIDAKCAVIQHEISIISMKIEYEESRGVAVDYSGMKRAFKGAGLSGLTGGQIEEMLDAMPDGLRWAIEYGMSHTKNNDYVHQESIIGKIVGSRAGKALSRNGERRRHRRRENYYNNEEPEGIYG